MPWRIMGKWSHSSTFIDLGTRWRWVVSFTLLPLYPRGKGRRYSLDRRLGGPQSRSGRWGEEKNLALPGMEPGRGRPARSPLLYCLSYPDSDCCVNNRFLLKINNGKYGAGHKISRSTFEKLLFSALGLTYIPVFGCYVNTIKCGLFIHYRLGLYDHV
jgi:hypothetical protein